MPLIKSSKESAVGKNIKKEVAAGKPLKQAEAISLSTQREAQKSQGKPVINPPPKKK